MNWWIDEKLRLCYFESWWIDELMKKLDENSGCVILKLDELMNWWTCVILKLMNWWKLTKTWWIDEKEVWRKTTIFSIFAKILKAITFNFPSLWTIFVKKNQGLLWKSRALRSHTPGSSSNSSCYGALKSERSAGNAI